jgi:L-ascorbate metabolism protein UlaG (beta-lactamase superfamily)
METKPISFLIIILVFGANCLWSQELKAQCSVTYVANDGFLCETKSGKILVDALFGGIEGNWCDQPNDSVSNLMLNGIVPFNNIDVVLITHYHSDHFNGPMVISFLRNNKKPVLICPSQVNDMLKKNPGYTDVANRIKSLRSDKQFDTLLTVNEVNIRALRFNHGSFLETDSVTGKQYDLHSGVENLGYIIDTDGFSLFHSGDCSFSDKSHFESYLFGDKNFDMVFLDRTFLRKEGQEIMNSLIHAKDLVFMHIEPGRGEYYKSIIKEVPGLYVFTKKMEKKLIIK